jgi:hypothetical protein
MIYAILAAIYMVIASFSVAVVGVGRHLSQRSLLGSFCALDPFVARVGPGDCSDRHSLDRKPEPALIPQAP